MRALTLPSSSIATVPPNGAAPEAPPNWQLGRALLAYAAIAAVVSWCQRGWYNSDFVAYVTVARTLLTDPGASVSGYWSPLFSWLMAPLIWLGIDDLVAGRLVLLTAGAGYIIFVHRLARALSPANALEAKLFTTVVLVCATLQAALWATHMLDPDLLGNLWLFASLSLVARGPIDGWRAFGAGACAGLAYLGKAFMLPFLVLFLPLALWLAGRFGTPSPGGRWWRSMPLVALGLLLTAGPWVWVLSAHYGHFTFSTAGPANHANIGPDCWGLDPLWNPPLQANYILDPHFGPDWSPLQSWGCFVHQLRQCGFNAGRSLGHLAGWVIMVVLALWVRTRSVLQLSPLRRRQLAFVLVPSCLYLSGYLLIDVERRYLLPTLAPLLCLGAMMLAGPWLATRRNATVWSLLLGLLFAAQEVRVLVITATRHPQSGRLTKHEHIAAAMARAGVADLPFAASHWHTGLGIAYASGALPRYLGRPRATTSALQAEELTAAGARCYLRVIEGAAKELPLPAPWQQLPMQLLDADDVGGLTFELFVRRD